MNGDEVPDFAQRRVGNKRLDDIYHDVVKRMHEAYEKNKKYYNLRRREKSFHVGQLVFYANKAQQSDKAKFISKKLSPNFLGPCTVESRKGTAGYMLRNAKGDLIGPYHVQDLVAMNDRGTRLSEA
ncbi:Transposon Tf2-11 polyprotein [Frankliniella fusca]|uniref:Transposon Tf2-11 polyprotein n=1 Tax=Frankliniella fusca TaxID=407009 RepID=A0AAE1HX96_9NEOP|nr:Transposon Tf2-11 polyprotein [Frankliniella fusca]